MARRSDERDAARAEYIARMEKDGEVNLRQLADDLHLKYDTVRRWKAKDGWDPPAPRKPGGQPGNKNAVGNPGGGAFGLHSFEVTVDEGWSLCDYLL